MISIGPLFFFLPLSIYIWLLFSFLVVFLLNDSDRLSANSLNLVDQNYGLLSKMLDKMKFGLALDIVKILIEILNT